MMSRFYEHCRRFLAHPLMKLNLLHFGVLSFLISLGLMGNVFIASAQAPDMGTRNKLSAVRQSTPIIEWVSQMGGRANNSWNAQGVTVSAKVAYVAAGDDGLRIVDLSNPTTPSELSFQDTTGYARGVIKTTGLVYVANSWGGLRIINASNPTALNEVGYYQQLPPSPDGPVVDVAVENNTAYLASFDEGLRLIDVSNPAAPIAISFYDVPSERVLGVAISGNTVYISGSHGLHIVDVSTATTPTQRGSHPGLVGWSNDVVVVGNTAYLADGLFGFGGLSIINVSNPAAPRMLGSIDLGSTDHLAISGRYAYAAVGSDLYMVDVSNPTNPQRVGAYNIFTGICGLAAVDNYVYIAAGDNGLIILRLLRSKITSGISTGGGYLASPNGDTYLDFPSGAFSDIVVLTYRHLWEDQDVSDLVGIGHTFELEAVYHTTGQPAQLAPGQTFHILIQYTDTKTGSAIEDTLALYYWNGSQWMRESSSTIDTASNTITAAPKHWTALWAVLGEMQWTFLPFILQK